MPSTNDTSTPAADTRTLTLADGYGTATATVATTDTGAVVYTVTAPYAHGAFTIRPAYPLRTRTATQLQIVYGDDSRRRHSYRALPNRPVVHGVPLVDTSEVAADQVPDIVTGRRVSVWREGRWSTEQAPPAATARTRAIVQALLTDYLTRPDLEQLHRLAAAEAATGALTQARLTIADLDERISTARAERRKLIKRIEALEQIAENGPLPASPVVMLAGL